MQSEFLNGGLPYENWTPVAEINNRAGEEVIWVINAATSESDVESPHVLHIASASKERRPSQTDQIHSLVYGIDGPDSATIYTVQQSHIADLSPGIIFNNARALQSTLRYVGSEFEYSKDSWPKDQVYLDQLNHLQTDGNNFTQIGDGLSRIRSQLIDDLNVTIDEQQTLTENSPEDQIKKLKRQHSHIQGAINMLSNYEHLVAHNQLEAVVRPSLDERSEKLKRFNGSADGGGASMVSLLVGLSLLKR